MSSGQGGGGHSLAFRVMRLCRPALQVDLGLRFDPGDLVQGEDSYEEDHGLLSGLDLREREGVYWKRTELERPIDALGLSGLLVLPQSFGWVFFSYSVALYYRVRETGFQYFFRHEYSDGKLRRSFHGCGPRNACRNAANSQNVVVNWESHETLGFQLLRMLHPRAAQLHVW